VKAFPLYQQPVKAFDHHLLQCHILVLTRDRDIDTFKVCVQLSADRPCAVLVYADSNETVYLMEQLFQIIKYELPILQQVKR
jgi:hypothetical protein